MCEPADATQKGSALVASELALEGIRHPIVLKRNSNVNCPGAVAVLVEVHWNTMLVVEPFPHVFVGVAELPSVYTQVYGTHAYPPMAFRGGTHLASAKPTIQSQGVLSMSHQHMLGDCAIN